MEKETLPDAIQTATEQHDDTNQPDAYSWSVSDPVVIEKTPSFEAGEVHLRREIARRTEKEDGGVRAGDQYATDGYGHKKSIWASLTGRNPSLITRMTQPELI